MYQFRNRATAAYPVTPAAIRAAHKARVSFGPTITDDVADALGYDVVQIDPQPQYNPDTQNLIAQEPQIINGVWQQGWLIVPYTDAELAAKAAAAYAASVPQSVTMRQARLALHAAGLLTSVNAAIAAIPEPDRTAASITWEFASSVDRGFGMVPQLAAALGMTETQIDDLFIAAAQL